MPHIIPVDEQDIHQPDMNCVCEPEILFGKGKTVTIVHKILDTDKAPIVVIPDDYYDK